MQSTCAASQTQSVAAATERKSGFNVVSRKRIGSNLTAVDYAWTISISQCTERNTQDAQDAPQFLKLSCANVDGQGPRSRKTPPPKLSEAVVIIRASAARPSRQQFSRRRFVDWIF